MQVSLCFVTSHEVSCMASCYNFYLVEEDHPRYVGVRHNLLHFSFSHVLFERLINIYFRWAVLVPAGAILPHRGSAQAGWAGLCPAWLGSAVVLAQTGLPRLRSARLCPAGSGLAQLGSALDPFSLAWRGKTCKNVESMVE